MATLASELFVGSAEMVAGVHHSWIYPSASFPMFQTSFNPKGNCLITSYMLSCVSESAAWETQLATLQVHYQKKAIFTHSKYLTFLIIHDTKCSYQEKKESQTSYSIPCLIMHIYTACRLEGRWSWCSCALETLSTSSSR